MIERDYYPLEQAAEILKYSKDDLIYLGVKGELPVYILTGKFTVACSWVDYFTRERVRTGYDDSKFVKLSRYCLMEIEAGKLEARAEIQPRLCYANEPLIGPVEYPYGYLYNDRGCKVKELVLLQLRHKDCIYPDPITLENAKYYPPPVTIKECVLVILADDLRRLQEPEQQSERISDSVGNEADIYISRKINFDEWLQQSQPDIGVRSVMNWTVEEAFNQVSQSSPVLWNISIGTFKRGFWQMYSNETGIKGRSGRPRKNKT